jgi:4-hydroxyproline epimerase
VPALQQIQVIDSHTAGEPTRVVIAGGPDLGQGPLSDRLQAFRDRFDGFRRAIVCEPRGSDVLVGALLCEPVDRFCVTGVIFFNNVGYLGMCGHGLIGVVTTLAHMNRLAPGDHAVETPVGRVAITLHSDGRVSFTNVPSNRLSKDVEVPVDGHGTVTGDIAWGGNWFFLVEHHQESIRPDNVERLTDFTWAIRQSLNRNNIRGAGGAEIDHVELFGPPTVAGANSKNFVLCPGKAYDRSPCGTGTSAKLACLVADGKIRPGEVWQQEGILGTIFEGEAQIENGQILPRITGQAYITAESTLLLDAADPFRFGATS